MLKELKKQLKSFEYSEKSEITEKEEATLKEMFSVEGSFNALFRLFSIIETERGVQSSYSIESLPTAEQNFSPEEVAEELRFKKMVTSFVRLKLEAIRIQFAKEINEEITEKEAKLNQQREKDKEVIADKELENRGVPEGA